MMYNRNIINHLEELFLKQKGWSYTIENLKSVGGGDINETYHLKTNQNDFFLKLNKPDLFPGMFEAEKLGLDLLLEQSDFAIPNPLFAGKIPECDFLMMEWVELTSQGDWKKFGQTLAEMHRQTHSNFGLDHQNYIGSLQQDNTFEQSWSEFYTQCRLHPLCKIAFDNGQIDRSTLRAFENLYRRLDEIYPNEPPAFLHGDLWSGNRAFTADGIPCIYDPAVYYGHREMDLAMTKLFGGFPDEMYRAYHQSYPLESGWENRISIGQLYPLLVHVILFGGGYAGQVRSIVRKFA